MEDSEKSNPSQDTNKLQMLFKLQQEEANQTIQTLLSSVRQFKQDCLGSLSSVPIHPYEKLKADYLPNNFAPLSIETIEQPTDLCLETCLTQISSISDKLNHQWSTQLCFLTCYEGLQENLCLGNAFASLSENVFVVDKEKAANHLSFVEMIKHIPIHLIEQQPKETAAKLISQFIKLYQT